MEQSFDNMQKQHKQKLYRLIVVIWMVAFAFLIKGIQKQDIVYIVVSMILACLGIIRMVILNYIRKQQEDSCEDIS